jgi:hypothetical protein
VTPGDPVAGLENLHWANDGQPRKLIEKRFIGRHPCVNCFDAALPAATGLIVTFATQRAVVQIHSRNKICTPVLDDGRRVEGGFREH